MKYCLIATHGQVKRDTWNLARECATYMDKVILLIDEPQKYDGSYETFMCENKGFDFGKVYQWLALNPLTEEDELLLTNETISPITSFKDLFACVQDPDYEFTGATSAYTEYDKQQIVNGYHIQSFFVYYKRTALRDMQEYYKKHGILISKFGGVYCYEFDMSIYMIAYGHPYKAFIEADYMIKKLGDCRYNNFIDATHHGKITVYKADGERNGAFKYPHLYIREGLPFVKNTIFQYGFRPPIIQELATMIYK